MRPRQQSACTANWISAAIWSEHETLVSQRDSDAQRDVASSRDSALSQFSTLSVQTGSNLTRRFESDYIPRVFCTTLPWCVWGPDFPRRPRWRRRYDDAPMVSQDTYTAMMAVVANT